MLSCFTLPPALVPCYGLNPSHRIAEVIGRMDLKRRPFKTELLRDGGDTRGPDPTRVPVPLYGNIGTFHSSPILPVFQFQKFPAKAAKPGQTGLSEAFEFVFKGQDRISTLTRAAGEPALEESERESRSPPLSTQEAGEGRAPSPQHSRQTPRRDAQAAGEEHRRELTHLALERAHCLQRSYLEPRPYATSRYCCSVGGLSLPVTRRTRTAWLARLTTDRGGMR